MICPVSAKQVRKALYAKGFRDAQHCAGRDHEMFFLHIEQAKTAFFVKLSHGATQLRVDEIKNNARNLGVTGDDLYRILCCDYDAEKTTEVYRGSRNMRR
jgi:hypothetical protein